MHFKVIEDKPPYAPIVARPPNFGQASGTKVSFPKTAKTSVVVEPVATKAMFSHIGWGNQGISENKVEQGGILVGEVYNDPISNKLLSVAKFAIPAENTKGSSTYLQITPEIWGEMIKRLDYLNEHMASDSLVIVGWYHTHPNDLGVFFSGTDKSTQARLFRQDWQVGVVLNPHKQMWTAFYGEKSEPTGGIIIDPESQLGDMDTVISTENRETNTFAESSMERDDFSQLEQEEIENEPTEGKPSLSDVLSIEKPRKFMVLIGGLVIFCVGVFVGTQTSQYTIVKKNELNKEVFPEPQLQEKRDHKQEGKLPNKDKAHKPQVLPLDKKTLPDPTKNKPKQHLEGG